MGNAFDPYYRWLGIPPKEQPPHHYRLLGIENFEGNADVIESAADRQMSHVRTFHAGRYAQESAEVLNALSAAKVCLLNTQQRVAYDQTLRARLSTLNRPEQSTPQSTYAQVPVPSPAQPAMPTGRTNGASAPHAGQSPTVESQLPTLAKRSEAPPPIPPPVPPGKSSFPIVAVAALGAVMAGLALVILSIVVWDVWSKLRSAPAEQVARNHVVKEPFDTTVQPSTKTTKTSTAALPATTSPIVEVPENKPVVSPFTSLPDPVQRMPMTPPHLVSAVKPSALSDIRTGLTHWWGLHEFNGTRRDSVGAIDLLEQGSVGSGPGLIGNSARLSRRDYLRTDSVPSLEIRGNLTISMWVRFSNMNPMSATQGTHALMGKWAHPRDKHDYVIAYHYERELPDRFEFLVWDANTNQVRKVHSSLSNAATDIWYFVVCQYDADQGAIGMSINDGGFDITSVGPIQTSNNPLFVGADHGPPWNNLNGDLGLIGMWNRVLTPAEITALYNNGAGVDVEMLGRPK